MAVRAVKVGDLGPNHIERNIVEFWKVDDDAGGAVASAPIALATAGRRAIGAVGCPFTLDANKRITIIPYAIAAGQASVYMIIFEAGPN